MITILSRRRLRPKLGAGIEQDKGWKWHPVVGSAETGYNVQPGHVPSVAKRNSGIVIAPSPNLKIR